MNSAFRSYREQMKMDSYREYVGFIEMKRFNTTSYLCVYKGDRVHLYSREGTYTVKNIRGTTVTLTTNKWIAEKERGTKTNDCTDVHISDIKCLYGQSK